VITVDKDGSTLLIWAEKVINLKQVTAAMTKMNAFGVAGWTPLVYVGSKGHIKVVQLSTEHLKLP
jgi:hypothetical protein